VPLLQGAGSPSNTMWPGSRPTSMPSFVLIHPTVWPQYTNVTDRQIGQDNGPIALGEPFYKRLPKITAAYLLTSQPYFSSKLTLFYSEVFIIVSKTASHFCFY